MSGYMRLLRFHLPINGVERHSPLCYTVNHTGSLQHWIRECYFVTNILGGMLFFLLILNARTRELSLDRHNLLNNSSATWARASLSLLGSLSCRQSK
uniref:AlNc14C681G12396 protein n=1 Tax=Albugo laibachii Nc14 TaxID=890382 RepID=F0X1T2_9STRA|nr:AlNc14C681G12396 [Albugo laibachii Nc14]|eukprot:CCA27785.1 AlNc14C681G12396 [Albugo laibachii Nc14]